MKNRLAGALVALSLAAFFAPAKSQGIPVIDVASITQMVTQYKQMVQQYLVLKDQLTNSAQTLKAMTGSRGMAALFDNPQLQSLLPKEAAEIYRAIKKSPSYQAQRSKFPTSSDPSINAIYDQTAATNATMQDFFDKTQSRLDQIKQLQGQIDSASDPAAKADLQNRIASEQNAIAATSQLLTVMSKMAEQDAQAARQAAQRNYLCAEFKKCK